MLSGRDLLLPEAPPPSSPHPRTPNNSQAARGGSWVCVWVCVGGIGRRQLMLLRIPLLLLAQFWQAKLNEIQQAKATQVQEIATLERAIEDEAESFKVEKVRCS